VTTDDFENPNSSPVPPYDRGWRHPAEVADTERARHLGASPPLGRRLTALTVIASVLTSLAVLTVAIPKGIEGYTQSNDDSPIAPTTVPSVKGSGLASIVGLRGIGGQTSALSLGNRLWLVATEDLKTKKFPASFGTAFTVVRENKDIGLSVIRVGAGEDIPSFNFNNIVDQLSADQLHDCRIIDAFQIHSLASEPSLSSQQVTDAHPVNMDTSVRGLAVVVNKSSQIVGLIVRMKHAHQTVPGKALKYLAGR
jgi:hypothetical protein